MWTRSSGWKHRKCTHSVAICMLHFVACSISSYTKAVIFFPPLLSSEVSHLLVCSLPLKSRKRLARDVFDILFHARLPSSWRHWYRVLGKNGGTRGTFLGDIQMLDLFTNRNRNWMNNRYVPFLHHTYTDRASEVSSLPDSPVIIYD